MRIDNKRDRDTQFNRNAPADRFQNTNFRYQRGWHQQMQESANVSEYGPNNKQATESILKSHPSQGLTNSAPRRSQSMTSEAKSHPLMSRSTMYCDSQSVSPRTEAYGHQPSFNVNQPDASTDLGPRPNCAPPNGTIAANRHLDELAHPLLLLSASKPNQKLAPSSETKSPDMGEHTHPLLSKNSNVDLTSTPPLLNLEEQPFRCSVPQLPVAKIKSLTAYPNKATTRKATDTDSANDTEKKRPRLFDGS